MRPPLSRGQTLAGGDCIAAADVLRTGGTARVMGCGVKAPSTLGTFLRSFRWAHVRQLRTFADWNAPPLGFLEIDLVVHHGGSWWGSMIHSLVATDICTGWTKAVPLLAGEQSLVVAGLEAIGQQLPFPVKGIDSDNDSVFINETLTNETLTNETLTNETLTNETHPVLRRAGHRVHPVPAVPQERPGLD